MIKLFRNFNKKEILLFVVCVSLVAFGVWLDLKVPDYMSEITRLVQTEGSKMADILEQGFYMIVCSVGSLITAIIVGYIASFLSASFSKTIRHKIFDKVENMSVASVKKFSIRSLITRTTNDVTQIEMLISLGLQMMVRAPIMAVWAVLKIIDKNVEWTLLILGCVLLLLTTVGIILIIVIPRFAKVQKLIDKINGIMREAITGIRVIRAFNAEEFQENRFADTNSDLTSTQLFNQRCFAIMMPVMNFVMHFLTLGIYFIGAFLINEAMMYDKINLFSDMVVFSSYGMQVIMSFLMLAMIFMMVPRAGISAKRINEVLDDVDEIKNGNFTGVTREIGTVEFKNVSFKYPDADEYLLKNISFKVNKGETVAFVGSTGSGKSTLINLVPRFYDATDGKVLVDGIDVKEYREDNLRNRLGYVSQKAVLFNDTVKGNISYGDNGRDKPDFEKIKKAVRVAQGEEFVLKMDKEYDSHIARGGTNISGGQKQRLSIARAIARDPEIYIFDDSFSALDYKTDAVLRKELKEYTKNATSLIVATRIGTIMNADKIIVLDKGECVGVGTHKELLKTCDIYKEIALSQITKEELENA